MTLKPLLFSDLHERHTGLTENISRNYSEAVRVCLDRHHLSPTEFSLTDNDKQDRTQTEWIATDDRTRNAWANRDDATRDGAYGASLAAVELMRGLDERRPERAQTIT